MTSDGKYQVADLKQAIRGVLTGININNVVDLNAKLGRAAITLLMKADVPEMTNRAAITLYDGVFDYIPPSTIFGSLILDARPQGNSRDSRTDGAYKKPLMDFDLIKQKLGSGVVITFEQRQAQPIMRVAGSRAWPRVTLDLGSSLTGWVVGGDAQDLAVDQTVYWDFPSSLRFNLVP